MSAAALDEAVYAASGIVKSFAGVRVLHGVDFTVRPGRIHGLFGHNGAGKSVMLKILSGADRPDGGSLRVGGEAVELASPHEALRQGIACVYQELRLIPQLTVAENLFLGRELRRHGFEDLEAMLAHTDRLLADYGLSIRASARVGDLSHPDKQIIEVIANLDRKARFLFLDEPTTALEGRQAAVLLGTVRRMVDERGIGAVLVSHKLDEVLGFCDDVTVMSGGRVMLRAARTEVTKQDIVAAIIGHAPAVAAGAVRRAVAVLALPRHALLAGRCTARTVDAIWHAAGDRAADFSWYTKRAILAGVYGATLLFWLRDASEDDAATLAFLDRRLQGVARAGQVRRQFSIFSVRYPEEKYV